MSIGTRILAKVFTIYTKHSPRVMNNLEPLTGIAAAKLTCGVGTELLPLTLTIALGKTMLKIVQKSAKNKPTKLLKKKLSKNVNTNNLASLKTPFYEKFNKQA